MTVITVTELVLLVRGLWTGVPTLTSVIDITLNAASSAFCYRDLCLTDRTNRLHGSDYINARLALN